MSPDPDQFSATRGWGRRTWHREAHKELLRRREQTAQPIARSRPARLLDTLHRLQENQQVEIQASEAYERWQAERRAGSVPGQRLGMRPKPYNPPAVPEGVMNKADPDSRMMPADDPGLQRAGGRYPRPDHRGGGDRGREP